MAVSRRAGHRWLQRASPSTSAPRPARSCCRSAHPDTDAVARRYAEARGEASRVDVMLVNPPTPDGGIWIRSQHRVGRRSRENMIWPQVSLAQMAALLDPTYSVLVVDAVAERMDWTTFEQILRQRAPEVLRDAADRRRRSRTTSTARSSRRASGPSRSRSAPTSRRCRARRCGRILRSTTACAGEPDLTLRDLIDHLEGRQFARPENIQTLFREARRQPTSQSSPARRRSRPPDLSFMKGLVWRQGRRGRGESDAPADRRPRRPAAAALPPAAAAEVPDAAHQGAVLLHRHEPRVPGRLHLLHQARELRPDDAPALAGEAARGDPGAPRARRPTRPHVRGPLHGEPRAGRRLCAGPSSTRA